MGIAEMERQNEYNSMCVEEESSIGGYDFETAENALQMSLKMILISLEVNERSLRIRFVPRGPVRSGSLLDANIATPNARRRKMSPCSDTRQSRLPQSQNKSFAIRYMRAKLLNRSVKVVVGIYER